MRVDALEDAVAPLHRAGQLPGDLFVETLRLPDGESLTLHRLHNDAHDCPPLDGIRSLVNVDAGRFLRSL